MAEHIFGLNLTLVLRELELVGERGNAIFVRKFLSLSFALPRHSYPPSQIDVFLRVSLINSRGYSLCSRDVYLMQIVRIQACMRNFGDSPQAFTSIARCLFDCVHPWNTELELNFCIGVQLLHLQSQFDSTYSDTCTLQFILPIPHHSLYILFHATP